MEVSVFSPRDRPEPRRLYIITEGVALYRGQQLGTGASWGAIDVLLRERPNAARYRAFALTYLHAQWLDVSVFDMLKAEYPRAYMLCRFWTMMRAVADYLIAQYRRLKIMPTIFSTADIQKRINERTLGVQRVTDPHSGQPAVDRATGLPVYKITSQFVYQTHLTIVKQPDPAAGARSVFKVIETHAPPPEAERRAEPVDPFLRTRGKIGGVVTFDRSPQSNFAQDTDEQTTASVMAAFVT